jgi:CrcB protein
VTVGTWVLVGLLGGAGAIGRFIVDGLVSERSGSGQFPWGTLVVNLSGAALLGGLAGAAVSGNAFVLSGTATLGSYTTLSTWMLETHRLGQDNQLVLAGANLVGSLLVGFAAVAAGHVVGASL